GRITRGDGHVVAVEPERAGVERVALRVADRGGRTGVERKRVADRLMVDDVRAPDLVRKGPRRDGERRAKQRKGPDEVHDEERKERFAPGQPRPEAGSHGGWYGPRPIKICRRDVTSRTSRESDRSSPCSRRSRSNTSCPDRPNSLPPDSGRPSSRTLGPSPWGTDFVGPT